MYMNKHSMTSHRNAQHSPSHPIPVQRVCVCVCVCECAITRRAWTACVSTMMRSVKTSWCVLSDRRLTWTLCSICWLAASRTTSTLTLPLDSSPSRSSTEPYTTVYRLDKNFRDEIKQLSNCRKGPSWPTGRTFHPQRGVVSGETWALVDSRIIRGNPNPHTKKELLATRTKRLLTYLLSPAPLIRSTEWLWRLIINADTYLLTFCSYC